MGVYVYVCVYIHVCVCMYTCGVPLFHLHALCLAEEDYFSKTEELSELIDQLTEKRWVGGAEGRGTGRGEVCVG